MANFADSIWNAAQYKLAESMKAPEFKFKPSAALMVFLANTNFLVPASTREAAWNQKASDQQVVEVYTLDKQAISTGSARAHDHTGNNNDSGKATLTYTTYNANFKYSIKQGDRNVFDLGAMVAAQVRAAAIAIHASVETALLASLDTNKSQVVISATPQSGEWDGTNHLFGVANANEDHYFQYLQSFMREQYYRSEYNVINNILADNKMAQVAQQGQGNSTNLGWQLPGIMAGVASTELANESGYDWMSYIMPVGSIGILPWIPKLNREGWGDSFKVGGSYRTIPDPLGSGLVFAVHEYAVAADNSSTYGEVEDINIQVEISVDLAPLYAPMSTSNLSPVFKAGLLT